MPKWLSKIDPRRNKRSAPSSEPQAFKVVCRCGESALGVRLSRFQQVICKQCGEPLFVLPRNVYPAPPPPKPEAKEVPAKEEEDEALTEAAEIEKKPTAADGLLGELAAESKGLTKKAKRDQEEIKQRRKEKQRTDGAKSRRGKKKAAREAAKVEQQSNPLLAKVPLRQRIRRQLSPFRLIVAAAILAIGGTAWWQIRSRSIESARLRFDSARKKAVRLLDEGDFAGAEPLLDEAVAAADLTDRQDRFSILMRQLRSEANVVNNLSDGAFGDAVARATAASREEMASTLMAEFGGRWMVLDTWIRPVETNDAGLTDFEVDVPLLLNDISLVANVTTTRFDVLNVGENGQPVVFAAKLLSCEAVGQGKKTQLSLRFDPNSIRLWATTKTYKFMGFQDDEVPEHLSQQADILGVEE
ncbi:MAG: hypothetical protein AB8G99_16735 [Planctomycetaceae bacterium]